MAGIDEIGSVQRWHRVTLSLVALVALIEGSFVLLVVYAKPLMAMHVVGSLTLGLLLGAGATLAGVAVAWGYIFWANGEHPGHELAQVESGR